MFILYIYFSSSHPTYLFILPYLLSYLFYPTLLYSPPWTTPRLVNITCLPVVSPPHLNLLAYHPFYLTLPYHTLLSHLTYHSTTLSTYLATQDDSKMSQRFSLWRTPPVLIVQLKRFQFDRVSRRKLTNKVSYSSTVR